MLTAVSRPSVANANADTMDVGWDKLASSAGPPEAPLELLGGTARRSAACPTLRQVRLSN